MHSETVLVSREHVFDLRLEMKFFRIGFRVRRACGTAHDVNDGAPEFITDSLELLSVAFGKPLFCREL
jgi:hypothetical protein